MQSTLPAREMTLALLLGGSHLSGTGCSAPWAWLLSRASFNVLILFLSLKKEESKVESEETKEEETRSSFEGIFLSCLRKQLVKTVLEHNVGHTWEVDTLKAISDPCIKLNAHGQEGHGILGIHCFDFS